MCDLILCLKVKYQYISCAEKLYRQISFYTRVTFLKNNSYRKIQEDATVYQNLLFHIYMKLSMFRATHRPSTGA